MVDEEVEKVTRLRPGHADMAGCVKYGQTDVRNVLERASARETAARVAAGSVARRLLEELGIRIYSHVVAIGPEEAPEPNEAIDWERVEASPVRCFDPDAEKQMIAAIDRAKESGDTYGGVFELVASNVPVGLGSYAQWDRRLDGRLAGALMSIPAAKGVEAGSGFRGCRNPGSQFHDVITSRQSANPGGAPFRRATNRAGGIEGGISNGEEILYRVAMKPISTLSKPLPSVDLLSGETVQAHYERSDVCVVPAAGVVGEAMMALVLADAFIEKFGGDHVDESRRNLQTYCRRADEILARAR